MNNQPLIRTVLRDTALAVSALSAGFTPDHSESWYFHCKNLIQDLKTKLAELGCKEADIEEVSYAQCALLDEVALRTLKGNDREVWERNPMQVCFFQSYNAGDILCDRIESLCKNHKDASPLVAETYLSVINLGFRGRYVLDEDALHTAQEQLKKITPAFPSNAVSEDGKLFYIDQKGTPLKKAFSLRPAWLLVGSIVVATVAYFAFGYYLDGLVEQIQAL